MSNLQLNELSSNSSKYSSYDENDEYDEKSKNFKNEISSADIEENENSDSLESEGNLHLVNSKRKSNPKPVHEPDPEIKTKTETETEIKFKSKIGEISQLKNVNAVPSKESKNSEKKEHSGEQNLKKDFEQSKQENELSSIYFQIDLASNTMDLKEVPNPKRKGKEKVYDRLYHFYNYNSKNKNKNKNININFRFTPTNLNNPYAKKISNKSFDADKLELTKTKIQDKPEDKKKIKETINKLYLDAKAIASKINQKKKEIDQQIILMSNKINSTSNAENLAKNKILKDVEKIYRIYKSKLGGITNESLFRSFLFDLGLIQTLNINSKCECNLISSFYKIITDFKLNDSLLLIILVELKFFTKKTNFDSVFDTFIKHKIGDANLHLIIRDKLREIFLNFLKSIKIIKALKFTNILKLSNISNISNTSKLLQIFKLSQLSKIPKNSKNSKNYEKRNQIKRSFSGMEIKINEQPLFSPKININSKELSEKREKQYQDKSEDQHALQVPQVPEVLKVLKALKVTTFNGDYHNENVKDIVLYRNNDIMNIFQKDKDNCKRIKNSPNKIKNKFSKFSKLRYELFEKFEKQEKERKDKLLKMKETLLEKEKAECNFTPKINEISKGRFNFNLNLNLNRPDTHVKMRNKISIDELLTSEEQNVYNTCLLKKSPKQSKFIPNLNSNFNFNLNSNFNYGSPKCLKENNPFYKKGKKSYKLKKFLNHPKIVIDMTQDQLLEKNNNLHADLNPHNLKNGPEQYS